MRSATIALIVPLLVVERADGARFKPAGYAMKMEGVIARAPGLRTLLLPIGDLLGLALYAGLHYMILANSAIVDVNVPGPKSNCVPLLDHKSRLGFDHSLLSFC